MLHVYTHTHTHTQHNFNVDVCKQMHTVLNVQSYICTSRRELVVFFLRKVLAALSTQALAAAYLDSNLARSSSLMGIGLPIASMVFRVS